MPYYDIRCIYILNRGLYCILYMILHTLYEAGAKQNMCLCAKKGQISVKYVRNYYVFLN